MSKLTISGKCSDMCYCRYEDDDGLVVEHNDYVPSGIGIGGGDYIEIVVDVKTGQIQNWNALSKFKILNAFHNS